MASTRLWGSAVEDNCSEFHTELWPAEGIERESMRASVLHQPSGIPSLRFCIHRMGYACIHNHCSAARLWECGYMCVDKVLRFGNHPCLHMYCSDVYGVFSGSLPSFVGKRGRERE